MKLTLLLIPLILLSSCTIDWNDEKDTKIAELEKQNNQELSSKNTDLFEKKQKCNEILKDLSSKIGTWESINEVFYSKKMDTCIVYKTEENGAFRLYDGLTGEYIIWVDMDSDATLMDSLHRFQAKALELKWE